MSTDAARDATRCDAQLRIDDDVDEVTHRFRCDRMVGHSGNHELTFPCLGGTSARLVWPPEALMGSMLPWSSESKP